MHWFKRAAQALIGCALLLGGAARAQDNELKLFTLNAYCFPEGMTQHLKNLTWVASRFTNAVGVVDLQSGIQKSTPQRIKEIGDQIGELKPDVVFFQELWHGKNKKAMVDKLRPLYKYNYYNTKIKMGATDVDDGLLIMSKWVPFYTGCLQFADRYDDETRAHKGALLMGLYNPKGGFLLVVNTHMQSGTSDEACAVKEKQVRQLATFIKEVRAKDPRLLAAKVVVAGDFNEPYTYLSEKKAIVDRNAFLARAWQDMGIKLGNDQTLAYLVKKYDVKKIYDIDQVRGKGTARKPGGAPEPLASFDTLMGRFNGSKGFGWSYWEDATEPTGWQVLDHVLLEPELKLKSFQSLRKRFLGDQGPAKAYDAYKAISDHAAVMVTIGLP